MHNGAAAALDFQKIVDTLGSWVSIRLELWPTSDWHALMRSRTTPQKVMLLNQDFLNIWKDADPGILALRD